MKFGSSEGGNKFGGFKKNNRDGGGGFNRRNNNRDGGGGRRFGGGGNRDGGRRFGGGGGRGRGGPRRGPPRGGSRGGGRGRGGPRGGPRGGGKVVIQPHRHEGVFIAKGGKDDSLATLNSVPGHSVYNEKRVSVETGRGEEKVKKEYRIWNPFRSKLAAAILGGVENLYIKPGTKLLYLGAASGTTVSHCSDLVGPKGIVYAVEFSNRSGRDLIDMAKKRTNVVPIIEDARHPLKYRMLLGMVDTIFADVAQPDQARIVALNAKYFLKAGGHFVISIKANCVDSTVEPKIVFEKEVQKLKNENFTPEEQLTLEPYERDHAVVVGSYRSKKK